MSKPFVVISSDTHVGASTYDAFTPYFDSEFRDEWASFAAVAGDDLFAMARMAGQGSAEADAPAEEKQATGAGALLTQAFSFQVDEADPIRRTFKRIMLALGVEPATVDEWAVHYSEDTIAGGGDSQK